MTRKEGTARTVALVGLFVLAILFTLYAARAVAIPIALAILLNFLLSPAIRWLKGLHVPEPLGAALILVSLLAVVAGLVMALAAPAATWVERMPSAMPEIKRKVASIARPLQQVRETAARVDSAAAETAAKDAPQVQVAQPSIMARAFGATAAFAGQAISVFFLTYFLLAAGDLFLRKVLEVFPQSKTRGPAVQIAREIEVGISRYLVTTTAVNIALGLATWALFAALGMPNAALWGLVAAVTNYVPYLGALAANVLFTAAAIVTFDSMGRALLVPASFFVLNLLESYVITPWIMGKRFPLNPVAIFVALMVWGYVWGVTGVVLAVPILVTLKIVCDHIDALEPVGAFLGN